MDIKKIVFSTRNAIWHFCYTKILRRIFFKLDPEKIHDRMTLVGGFLGKYWITRNITNALFVYNNPTLSQKILGIVFENPVGLAAGFDKNAQMVDILQCVGFGFAEVGSVTGEPCKGNDKPRLWRLPKSKGLVVNYGLKNDGCDSISRRLSGKKFSLPIGISVAKTNSPETVEKDRGIADYVKAFEALKNIGDYVTINISCPNAFGGCPFTNREHLEDLLSAIGKKGLTCPVFVKLPANISDVQIDEIVDVSLKYGVSGFVCTNLNKDRKRDDILEKEVPSKGGISGKVLRDESNRIIRRVFQKTGGKSVIIGCGGIFSAQDAYEKIKAGANLLQLITGMIYEGPQLISSINIGLAELLKKDGLENISEAVGKEKT